MAYREALSEGEVHSRNTRSARDWIERNRGLVKAAPNKSVVYSGRELDFDVVEDAFSGADVKVFKDTALHRRLDNLQQRLKLKVGAEFQTLQDVLTGIRSYPEIVDKDRIALNFAHAYECYDTLEAKPGHVPKAVVKGCWDRLSQIFVQNAKGDIKILDGLADDYGKLGPDKIFTRVEMAELLKSTQLSAAGKKALLAAVAKYGSYFDRRYTKFIAQLDADKAMLLDPKRK